MSEQMRLLRMVDGGWPVRRSRGVGPLSTECSEYRPYFSDSDTVFVAKSGADTNAGTQSAPKKTINAAVAAAMSAASKHYVAILDNGYYEERIDMPAHGSSVYPDIWSAEGFVPQISNIGGPTGTWIDGTKVATGKVSMFRSGYHYMGYTDGTVGGIKKISDETGANQSWSVSGLTKIVGIADYGDGLNMVAAVDGSPVLKKIAYSNGAVTDLGTIPGESVSATAVSSDGSNVYFAPYGDTDDVLAYYSRIAGAFMAYDASGIAEVYGGLSAMPIVLNDDTDVFYFASAYGQPGNTLAIRVPKSTGTPHALLLSGTIISAALLDGSVYVSMGDRTSILSKNINGGLNESPARFSGGMNSAYLMSNGIAIIYRTPTGFNSYKDGNTRILQNAASTEQCKSASFGSKRALFDNGSVYLSAAVTTSAAVETWRGSISGCKIDGNFFGEGARGQGSAKFCEIFNCTTAANIYTHSCIVGSASIGLVLKALGASAGSIIAKCGTGVEMHGDARLESCTIAYCLKGASISGARAGFGAVAENIIQGNVVDIVASETYEIASNLYRTSNNIVQMAGTEQIADAALFVDSAAGDYSLRDKARGYPYDSPGIGAGEDGHDFGAYRVNRTHASDAEDLDVVLAWNPDTVQIAPMLVQMNAQDMIEGGLAVQSSGCWKSWTLTWADSSGHAATDDEWRRQLSVLEDIFRRAGDGSELFFGWTDDGGATWATERTVEVTCGEGTADGDRRTLTILPTLPNYERIADIARTWIHRYVDIYGEPNARIASVTKKPGVGVVITTETDVYPAISATAVGLLTLLKCWRAEVDPRQSLTLTRVAPWAETSETGASIALREVPT